MLRIYNQWQVVYGSTFLSQMSSLCDRKTSSRVVKMGHSFPYPRSSREGRCPPILFPLPSASWMWICGYILTSNVPERDVISNGPSTLVRTELLANLSQQYVTLPTAEARDRALSQYGASILVRVDMMSWFGCSRVEIVYARLKNTCPRAEGRRRMRNKIGMIIFIGEGYVNVRYIYNVQGSLFMLLTEQTLLEGLPMDESVSFGETEGDEILCEVICGHDADAAHSSRAEESESCKFGDAQQVIGEEVAGPTQKHKD